MTARELLRKEVRQYIKKADEKTLRMVLAILEIQQEDEGEDCWDELPEELKNQIERGMKDADEGRVIPHEEFVKKYPKLFKQ